MTFSNLGLPTSLVHALSGPGRDTRDQIKVLSQQLATGRIADAGAAVRHDFSALADAERDIALNESLALAVGAGQRHAQRGGEAVDRIMMDVGALREVLKPGISGGAEPDLDRLKDDAGQALTRAIDAMGARSDGRSVFGAGRADAGPLDAGADVVAALDAAVAGMTDPVAVEATVTAFFAAGGGFAANHVTAGTPGSLSLHTGPDETVAWDVTATSPDMMRIFEGLGQIYAAASSDVPAADVRVALSGRFQSGLSNVEEAAIDVRARVGEVESRLQMAADRLAGDRADAERRRSDLIGADPYGSAVRLEEETARLETVYTLTARLSRLRLTDYL
ncbi:flagellin [Jannaschia sp. LMIT008]|uniref:flagellin n=1 Tax=Jannaschia maritima TaxID=3032585 RepID=UPI002811E8CA|nr:flagellin [Jannaschia sp. LMIT008]